MNKKSESGQAIVLLALAVIGLIGFTALAIDGGSVFADRRRAQSASDAASLAGGGHIALWLGNSHIDYDHFNCSNQTITDIMNYGIYKAQERAEDNDFIDPEIGVSALCEDNGPLFDEKYIDISTNITTTTKTSFLQVVFEGPVTNEVRSTVRVRPTDAAAHGNSIVALNPDPCLGNQNGMILGGSNSTLVEGGGIWSNGCMQCEGLNGKFDDEGNWVYPVEVIDGTISYGGMLNNCDPLDLSPFPQHSTELIPYSSYSTYIPPCNETYSVDSIGMSSKSGFSGHQWCVTSDKNAIKLPSGDFTATDVTFVIRYGGDIEINADEVIMKAAPLDWEPSIGSPNPYLSPPIPGVLIYVPQDYECVIKINGNVDSEYAGMIYAPSCDITINGDSTSETPVNFYTQVIGWNIHITGNAVIDFQYNKDQNLNKPAYLDLLK